MRIPYPKQRSREANRKLNISWCGKKREYTLTPTYLGVILGRTLSYSTHIAKVEAKTAARKNVIKKLSNSKWGAYPATIRRTALALIYSTAEYACTMWERSVHAHKFNPVLNDAGRRTPIYLKNWNETIKSSIKKRVSITAMEV